MPTENRSSNTEGVSELLPCPFCKAAMRVESNRDWHRVMGEHDEECVFLDPETMMVPATDEQLELIVRDWNRRANPAEQHQGEPVAWMIDWPEEPELGHYFSDESNPGARSRPLYAHPAPVVQTGEPVSITDDMRRLMEAYRLGEFTTEGGSDTIEALAVASFDAVADRGHDADSYMAGFCASLYWQAAPFIGLAIKPSTHADAGEVERLREGMKYEGERAALCLEELQECESQRDEFYAEITGLRAQRAERDALLRSLKNRPVHEWANGKIEAEIDAALSASAEPSAPVERAEWAEFQREERYVVIKISKMHPYPYFRAKHLRELKRQHSDALVDCVVIEKDWPEYEAVWAAIEARAALERKPS